MTFLRLRTYKTITHPTWRFVRIRTNVGYCRYNWCRVRRLFWPIYVSVGGIFNDSSEMFTTHRTN